jgi:molecular chaperone GrpE
MTDRKHKEPTPQPPPAQELKPEGEAQEEIIGSVRDAGMKNPPAEVVEQVVSLSEYNELKQAFEEAEAKKKEYFEGWQRERADFSNYKRRIERDQAMLSQNITVDVIKKYLLVLDDLDRAMKMRPTEGEVSAWANGIELIYRKLQNILDAENVKRIQAENEEFNPLRHEAISYEESPAVESGHVIEVVQEGYTLGDRVIRPARVRVAR